MIIIDGYNLLYAMRGIEGEMPIRDIEKARQNQVDALVRYHNITEEQMILVYDARGRVHLPNDDYPGVHVVYAPPLSDADDYIVRAVRNAPTPERVIVITTDQELSERVRDYGGRTTRSGDFYMEMKRAFREGPQPQDDKSNEKPEHTPPEEVELYLRLFGEGPRK